MADTEVVPFENQKSVTRYTESPLQFDVEGNFEYDGGDELAARNNDGEGKSRGSNVESFRQDQRWIDHHPTPPITVPYAEGDHSGDEDYNDDSSFTRSSPLDKFTRKRRPSISFNPEVTLDCGRHHALEEPLRKLRLEEQAVVESPGTGDSPESEDDQSESPRGYSHRPLFPRGYGQQPLPSPNSDSFSIDTELPRASSLTSLSTVSPVTDELRTPPDGRRDIYSRAMSSPFCQPHSLDTAEGWFGRFTADGKPRGFSSRHNSMRLRHGSRRSTTSGGKSPALAFLSSFGKETAAPRPDDEGQVVGADYVLGKTIGYGGSSTVKEAFKVNDDGKTDRQAVKIVKKDLVGQTERENEQFQAEFDHEVRIWRYLNHPNILPLDAVYETDYATFCFTRLTNGGTLFDLVKTHHREGLRLDQAKHYAYQLSSAVRYLHEDARIVHRDVKLENCLLHFEDPNDREVLGKLYLCDFGMSEWMNIDSGSDAPAPYNDAADRPPPRNIGPSNMSTSVAGGVAGSLEYAAPELIMSKVGILEPSVDMWALGVIVFALIAGSRPFDHTFQPKVQTNIVHGRWDQNALFKGDDGLEERHAALELIQGCLELDPLKRWTIGDVLACRWFDDCAEQVDEHINTKWKY